MDKFFLSMELERELLSGRDAGNLIRDMYCCFGIETWNSQHRASVLRSFGNSLLSWIFDYKTYKELKDFLNKVIDGDLNEEHYEEFNCLMRSYDFKLLCFDVYLRVSYCDDGPPKLAEELISLVSSDEVVFKMHICAATAESVVLNDVIGLTGDGGKIPVPVVPSGVLPIVIEYCEMIHQFRKKFETLAGSYKAWVTEFVGSKHAILSNLHQAADFLHIQSLLDLTSQAQAMGDMTGKPLEEISECCGNSSISRMLSSLGVGEDVHHHKGTPSSGEDVHNQAPGVSPWAFA